jgi:hypothetical protein
MKLVSCMGEVWSVSDRKYKALVEFIASGGNNINMDYYGKYLGSLRLNVSDMYQDLINSCRREVPGYPEYDEYQKVKVKLGM